MVLIEAGLVQLLFNVMGTMGGQWVGTMGTVLTVPFFYVDEGMDKAPVPSSTVLIKLFWV
ncbi:hypothetical protein C3E90_05775 [Clostridium sp. Cult2]|nr:hypothetical protein [Clostridium sp. Cult2]